VLTDGRFLSLTATSAGHKRIMFPSACTVVEALTGQVVAEGATQLEIDLALGETRMYLLR